jgi:hypothetical protein
VVVSTAAFSLAGAGALGAGEVAAAAADRLVTLLDIGLLRIGRAQLKEALGTTRAVCALSAEARCRQLRQIMACCSKTTFIAVNRTEEMKPAPECWGALFVVC